jgi:hypothetical protein
VVADELRASTRTGKLLKRGIDAEELVIRAQQQSAGP